MKYSNQFKGIHSLVGEIVNQFSYSDFGPDANLSVVKQRFISALNNENAYWKVIKEPENSEWCILAVKSHNSNLYFTIKICFSFKIDRIRIVICEDLEILQYLQQNDPSSSEVHINHSIYYRDFWKNHEKLYIALLDVFERSLEYAEREKHTDPFPGPSLTLSKELDETCI